MTHAWVRSWSRDCGFFLSRKGVFLKVFPSSAKGMSVSGLRWRTQSCLSVRGPFFGACISLESLTRGRIESAVVGFVRGP